MLYETGVCEINTHLDVADVLCRDPAPLRYPTAPTTKECLFHRPIALTLLMSVNIDIRGDGGSPTSTTSRMSVHFTDAGRHLINIFLLEAFPTPGVSFLR